MYLFCNFYWSRSSFRHCGLNPPNIEKNRTKNFPDTRFQSTCLVIPGTTVSQYHFHSIFPQCIWGIWTLGTFRGHGDNWHGKSVFARCHFFEMMLIRWGYFSTSKSKILGNNFILFVMFEYKKTGVMINSATANQMESTLQLVVLSVRGWICHEAGGR